jgi:hypothetical protein
MQDAEQVMSKRLHRLARVSTVVLIAAGAGHFLQSGDRGQAVAPAAAADADPGPTAPPAAETAAGDPCAETLDLVAEPGAMLALALVAPCRGDAPVVLYHAGLTVSARLDSAGTLALRLPALDADGAVEIRFMDGHRLSAAAPVGDLGGITRVAVQWSAVDSFALHAFAPGAERDGPGHVSASRPGARDGAAGWIAALGDASVPAPVLAEVYTFPGDPAGVTLDLEAALTPATCGRAVMAELIERADGRILRRDLVIPMPDCAEGDGYLVLQNPFADRKRAGN